MDVFHAFNDVLNKQVNELHSFMCFALNTTTNTNINTNMSAGANLAKMKELSQKGVDVLQTLNRKIDEKIARYDDSVKMVGGGHRDDNEYKKYKMSEIGMTKLENTRKSINLI